MNPQANLLLFASVVILALITLIARFKLHPFVALTLAALVIGLHSNMKMVEIAKTFQEGVGNTLGFLALVIGLGMILGKMLAESGGAHVIAQTFMRWAGPSRIPWAMLLLALVVGIPTFFAVGLMLLVPVIYAIARETKLPLLLLGIPAVAGLSCAQGFLPPHPGPMLAIEQLGANTGKTIAYGFLIGIPTAIAAGPFFALFIVPRLPVIEPPLAARAPHAHAGKPPGFALTLLTVLLPVLLMLLAALADLALPTGNDFRLYLDFVGSPIIAMLLAVLLAFYTFGFARGFSGAQILKLTEDCLGPAAGILLVVGAGGGLSRMLDKGGVGAAIAEVAGQAHVSPLLLGWVVAASIRVAVGSATVAIAMGSAILAPVVAATPGIHRELLVLSLGAGSLFCSHVNDAGFWLVKESLQLSVAQTLKTWTVLETGIGLVALTLILLLDKFI